MSDDDQRPLFNRPAAHLLDELESIRGSLTEGLDSDDDTPADIPLLDDMVIHNLNKNAQLLDIDRIFDEAIEAPAGPAEVIADEPPVQFPRFTLDVAISDDLDNSAPDLPPASPPPRQRVRPDYSREVLIQELVDEFIPKIEAELHARLRQLDDIVLRRLKDSQ